MADRRAVQSARVDHFAYRAGELMGERVRLADIAGAVGTPTYVYSRRTMLDHYDRLAGAFADLKPMICFSLKSASNIHLARLLVERGAGLDVVSGGEIHRARVAGCPASSIVYAGVGKTEAEIAYALGAEPAGDLADGESGEPIGLFNVESEPEFELIASVAGRLGVTTNAALRVNPDVDPETHHYITTGRHENKFGVDLGRAVAFFDRFGRNEHVHLTGLHVHIGSSVYQTEPYAEAVRRALGLLDQLASRGFQITTLDLGGGFGADYETGRSPLAAQYAQALTPLLKERVERGLKLILEPGRTIVANAGVLLTRVQFVKQSSEKKFIICDAGMHTLLRPALYQAFHFIWPVNVKPDHVPPERCEAVDLPGLSLCDIVGPICESADFLGLNRRLPCVKRGDLLAVFTAGAYGFSLTSRYNSHPLPAEVLIDDDRATVIRRRETIDDALRQEFEPEELESIAR